jgi:hypothetical protein
VYQQTSGGASHLDASSDPFRKFAGSELEDFLLAKALECFAHGWSESDTQDRVDDWNILKAKAAALLDETQVEAIVARAAKVEKNFAPLGGASSASEKNQKNRTTVTPPQGNPRRFMVTLNRTPGPKVVRSTGDE